jgi:hypothetical protein
MKAAATPIIDGGRLRCVACGHPRSEHRERVVCTVPKCACRDYQLPIPA